VISVQQDQTLIRLRQSPETRVRSIDADNALMLSIAAVFMGSRGNETRSRRRLTK